MATISWDIGINNLAYCILDESGNIAQWDVIDLLADIREPVEICQGKLKSGKNCDKTASITASDGKKYCKIHGKKIAGAKEITAKKNCSGMNKTGKACKMATLFKKDGKHYCKKHCPTDAEKDITTDNITFFERSQLLPRILDKIEGIHSVKTVLIENQPVHKNPIMKSIQMLLYSYYLMRDVIDRRQVEDIVLLNANNKLKIYDGPEIRCEIKDTHGKNKFLGKNIANTF